MARGDIIQGPREAKGVSTSVSPSWATTPVAGNILWALAMHAGGDAIPATPSGWTLVRSVQGASFSAVLWVKLAAGDDAVPSVTWAVSDAIYLGLGEIEWQLASLEIASSEDVSNVNTNVSAQSTGSVTAGNETTNVFLGVVGVENGASYDPGESITAGGFAQVGAMSANIRPGALYGTLVDAAGANGFTVTSGDTSDFAIGFIAAFSETAAATNPGLTFSCVQHDESTATADGSVSYRVLTDANPPVEVIAQTTGSITSGVLTIDSDSITIGNDYLVEILRGTAGSRTLAALIPAAGVDLDA